MLTVLEFFVNAFGVIKEFTLQVARFICLTDLQVGNAALAFRLALLPAFLLLHFELVVLFLNVLVFTCKLVHLSVEGITAYVQLIFMRDLVYNLIDANLGIMLLLTARLVKDLLQCSVLSVQLSLLLVVFRCFLCSRTSLVVKQQFRFRNLVIYLRQFLTVAVKGEERLPRQLRNHFPASLIGAIGSKHTVSLMAHLNSSVFLLAIPLADVIILDSEVLHLRAYLVQVDIAMVSKVHRVDDDILNDLALKALVEEDVLYGPWYILILCTLHNGESP